MTMKKTINVDELLAWLENLDDQAWTRKNTTMGLTIRWIMAGVRDMAKDDNTGANPNQE